MSETVVSIIDLIRVVLLTYSLSCLILTLTYLTIGAGTILFPSSFFRISGSSHVPCCSIKMTKSFANKTYISELWIDEDQNTVLIMGKGIT